MTDHYRWIDPWEDKDLVHPETASPPVSALLGADCDPCSTCGALPCDQTKASREKPYGGYEWDIAKINGRWCVGMKGNLDTIHDAQVIINNHSQSDAAGWALALKIAAGLNGHE